MKKLFTYLLILSALLPTSALAEVVGTVFIRVEDSNGVIIPGMAMIYPYPTPPGSSNDGYLTVNIDPEELKGSMVTVVIQLDDLGGNKLPECYDKKEARKKFKSWISGGK